VRGSTLSFERLREIIQLAKNVCNEDHRLGKVFNQVFVVSDCCYSGKWAEAAATRPDDSIVIISSCGPNTTCENHFTKEFFDTKKANYGEEIIIERDRLNPDPLKDLILYGPQCGLDKMRQEDFRRKWFANGFNFNGKCLKNFKWRGRSRGIMEGVACNL
jgi:hypothetical protein